MRTQNKEKFKVIFNPRTQIGYTYPQPAELAEYYKDTYWNSPSLFGKLKDASFKIFQKRRIGWLRMYGRGTKILDVGSGEAVFGNSIKKDYQVTNIEPVKSAVKNSDVLKLNFLNWKIKQKFDCVCFWESLEHTPTPKNYLKKAGKLLNPGGIILIEYPRFNSLESRLFGKYWFHQDLPRHLSHLTDDGLKRLLVKTGFGKIRFLPVMALEYAPWGFMASLLALVGINTSDSIKRSANLMVLVLVLPALFVSVAIEIILFALGESPIGFIKAEKK